MCTDGLLSHTDGVFAPYNRPVADEEVHLLLIERSGTRNTGDVVNERTTTAVRA